MSFSDEEREAPNAEDLAVELGGHLWLEDQDYLSTRTRMYRSQSCDPIAHIEGAIPEYDSKASFPRTHGGLHSAEDQQAMQQASLDVRSEGSASSSPLIDFISQEAALGAREHIMTDAMHGDLLANDTHLPGVAAKEKNRDEDYLDANYSLDPSELQRENERLRARIRSMRRETHESRPHLDSSTKWPVVNKVTCHKSRTEAFYLDPPFVVKDLSTGIAHLAAHRQVWNVVKWEEKQKNTPFVVYRHYSCEESTRAQNDEVLATDTGAHTYNDPEPNLEEVHTIDSRLTAALTHLLKHTMVLNTYVSHDVMKHDRLRAPYVFFYHCEQDISNFVRNCGQDRAYLELLMEYISEASADVYADAREHFERGEVTPTLMPFLFCPDTSLLQYVDQEPLAVQHITPIGKIGRMEYDPPLHTFTFQVATVVYDGKWSTGLSQQYVELRADDKKPIAIASLSVFPLHHAEEDVREMLYSRGCTFLRCRESVYMTSSRDEHSGRANPVKERYMIDVQTYQLLHPPEEARSQGEPVEESEVENLVLRLPAKIQGFRMSDKRWVMLRVADLLAVEWNTSAFDDLVIPDKPKELIKALIENKIETDKSIELVEGKGTGLVVLLHGGPGTGKTLTAESVAEIASKPLYRVTCGDIGTDPADVEEYLNSVFLLGRRWGCVVLLDEADVFLEERSLDNLERNALVSVFLRAIEYYDGILILTSNRVGRFDEAFKSRVQLALPYQPLTEAQRFRIWQNFLKRLRMVEESALFDEIEARQQDLAKVPMNGRQIRNAINNARQLARSRRKPLSYEHLEHVIDVSRAFDVYLDQVRGVNEESLAREKGDR